MAIIKMQKVKAGKPSSLRAVLEYIQFPLKTEYGRLVSAKDCLLECAYEQMYLLKQDHKQLHGRQYVHIIQSFSSSDQLNYDTAHEIGQKLLNRFKGYQGLVATHNDREHLHNHIVLNSVNTETGLKWQQSKKDLQALKDFSDSLCKEYGLSVLEKGQGWKSYGENKANNRSKSWKYALAEEVAKVIQKSNNREEFIHYLNDVGIEVDFRKDGILFVLDDGKKCLGATLAAYGDYSEKNISDYFEYNQLTYNDALANPRLMTRAVGLASEMLGRDDRDELEDKYLRGKPMSALEGAALKNAIFELKKGGKFIANKTKNYEGSKAPYLLMTIADTLEVLVEDKRTSNQYESFRKIFDEEDELEM